MTDKKLPQYEHNGRSLTVPEWAAVTGIRSYDISMRLRQGWTLARIIAEVKPASLPPASSEQLPIVEQPAQLSWAEQLFTHNGESMDLKGWSAKSGIPIELLKTRLKSGWGLQRALTYPAKGAPSQLNPGSTPAEPRTITYAGETLTLRQWAARAGITLCSLHWRLARWDDLGRVLTTPKIVSPTTRHLGGMNLKEAAQEAGLSYSTLMNRLCHGWALEDALRVPARSIMGNNVHRRVRGSGTAAGAGGGSATSKARRGPAGDGSLVSAPKQAFS